MLLLVHALIAVHLAHWWTTGSTVSPLEPSEAMEFSKRGIVNAGFLFFALTGLSTLILGRFFCGWACHLVALQDLCRWMLMKIGLRPRPLRSRLLALVPLGAFLYMFLWPFAWRLVSGAPGPPGVELELTKSDFWATFPGPWIGAATFVICGFACVYFLGAKGFCTYACPYGALFGFVDRASPVRIRVTDACEQCGHCTSTCSSNVTVHDEVRRYGMVVDPGCMKCLDCVSVCPMNALYLGVGRPAIGAKPKTPPPTGKRRGRLPWLEEGVLASAFAAALATTYGPLPFLFALGASGVLAFVVLVAFRALRGRDTAFLGWTIRRAGAWAPVGGPAFLALLLVVAAGWAWAGGIRVAGRVADARYERTRDVTLPPGEPYALPVELDGAARRRVDRALAASRFVERWNPFPDGENQRRLAWLAWLAGDARAAAEHLRSALELQPRNVPLHLDAHLFFAGQGALEESLAALRRAAALRDDAAGSSGHGAGASEEGRGSGGGAPSAGSLVLREASLLAAAGRIDEAREAFERALEREPESLPILLAFGYFEAGAGRADRAIELFRRAVRTDPGDPAARYHLGTNLARSGNPDAALGHLFEAARLDPRNVLVKVELGRSLVASGDVAEGGRQLREAFELGPGAAPAVAALADWYDLRGEKDRAAELRSRLSGGSLPDPQAPPPAPGRQ